MFETNTPPDPKGSTFFGKKVEKYSDGSSDDATPGNDDLRTKFDT